MNKTILITGSTDGIGKLAAIQLAKDGHHIYLHGRNPQKLEKVIEEVKALSKNNQIEGFVADFSDLNAVKTMAQDIIQNIVSIDILINNAGVFKSPVQTTKDGFDIRMAVNYLAPYILTHAILPLLKKGENARIVNLSSAAQAPVSMDFLQGKTKQAQMAAYSQSKLAITMWSFYLAKKLQNITVIPVNPGSLLDTNMVREGFGQVWSSADKGSDILYDLAVGVKYEGITGKYFDNDQGDFGMAHQDAYKEARVQELIKITEGLLQ